MDFKRLFQSYRVGAELADGEHIQAVTGARLLHCAPQDLSLDELRALGQPPWDERLIATDNYLVYDTNYALLDVMKAAWVGGAKRYAGEGLASVIERLADWVDTTENSVWIPYGQIHGVSAQRAELNVPGLFGSSVVTVYYFEVSTAAGTAWFAQVPLSSRASEKAFHRMADALGLG